VVAVIASRYPACPSARAQAIPIPPGAPAPVISANIGHLLLRPPYRAAKIDATDAAALAIWWLRPHVDRK
jgi:hypothetical protein